MSAQSNRLRCLAAILGALCCLHAGKATARSPCTSTRQLCGFQAPPLRTSGSHVYASSFGRRVAAPGAGAKVMVPRSERAQSTVMAADIGKIMADELYAPMFLQALFLSFSGILVAVALAAVIRFKGEDLQKLLVEEAYQETTALKEKLGATQEGEDGTIVIGFNKSKQEAPAASSAAREEAAAPVAAVKEVEPAKELVSAGSGRASAASSDLGDDYDD